MKIESRSIKMKHNEDYIRDIFKLVQVIINRQEKVDIDNYLEKVKRALFYIGKSLLAITYLKDNIIDERTFSRITQLDDYENTPQIFKHLSGYYTSKMLLSEDDKEKILEVLLKIDIDNLKNFSIGLFYETLITSKERKCLGQVYTPDFIVEYIVKNSISEADIITNPYFRVIDPACGGGYFLIEAYNRIKSIFIMNYEEIIDTNPFIINDLKAGIDQFIIRNNLWGVDVDPFAVFMTTVSLLLKSKGCKEICCNIFNKDVLLDELEEFKNSKFDLVIGNPPYIGHKKIDKDYRKEIENIYNEVYTDKSDISYCFFKRGYQLLNQGGKLTFITSRYFQESPSAFKLRNYVSNNFKIEEIVDFYGENIFKGIGISPSIIRCSKKESHGNMIHIYKLRNNKDIWKRGISSNTLDGFESFYVNQDKLEDDGWILITEIERRLYDKINLEGNYRLDEVCDSFQGIITGYDRAFIVEDDIVEEKNLERDIIKPWIKNSSINKYGKIKTSKSILYANKIEDPVLYPNTIKHLKPYKDRLGQRRECLKGIRQWYHLQWGRELETFGGPNIMFPFKAKESQFTIGYNEVLCSADIYILKIKEKYNLKDIFIVPTSNDNTVDSLTIAAAQYIEDRITSDTMISIGYGEAVSKTLGHLQISTKYKITFANILDLFHL